MEIVEKQVGLDFDFNVILNISSCIIWVRQDLYIVDISTIFYLLKAFEQ